MDLLRFLMWLFCIDRIWSVSISFTYDGLVRSGISGRRLPNPIGSFYADPFYISVNDFRYILVEQYNYFHQRGSITALVVNEKGGVILKKEILKLDTHLSFPRLVYLSGELYLTVENVEAGPGLLLCKLNESLEVVSMQRVMIEYLVIDPIIFEEGGKFWLYFNSHKGGGGFNERSYKIEIRVSERIEFIGVPILLLDSYLGSRNAGTYYFNDVKLISSQLSTKKTYGYGLVLSGGDKKKHRDLSGKLMYTTAKKQIKKGAISIVGIHTLNVCDNVCVFDEVSYRFNYARFFIRPISKILKCRNV